MADNLELVLSTQMTRFVEGLGRAGRALEAFRKQALLVQQAVSAALADVDAAGKALGQSLAQSLGGASAAAASARRDLKGFGREASKAFDGLGDAAEEAEERTGKAAKGIGDNARDIGKATAQAGAAVKRGFGDVGAVVAAGTEKLKASLFSAQTAFAALGGGALFKRIVDESSSFETALANVGTLLDGTGVKLDRYREQVLALSGATSKDLVDLTRGLYQTVSSGIPAVEGAGGAFAVLDASQKAAVAGLASTEEAVKAITGVLNAYKGSGLTAAEVSDKLFQTVNRGVVEFPELARGLGDVSGVAAAFGVSLDDVLGAIATVTKSGIPASVAINGIRQALVSIARPPENVQKNLKALNLEFGVTALQQKGFVGILNEISAATGGSSEALVKLFTDVDGLKAVLPLVGKGAQGFAADVTAMATAAGSTDKAYKLLSDTFTFQAGVLQNKVRAVFVAIGEKVLPALQGAFSKLGAALEEDQGKIASAIAGVTEALISLATFVAGQGKNLVVFFGTLFAVEKVIAVTAALKAFGAALSASVASAAAGAAAAGQFLTGWQLALSNLGGIVASALRSPAALALIVAAAVFIGEKVGNLIGKALTKDIRERTAKLQAEVEGEAKRQEGEAKAKGFASVEARTEATAAFAKGELVSLAPGGELKGGRVFPADEALKEVGGSIDVFEAAVAKTAQVLTDRATAARTQAANLRAQLREVSKFAAQGNNAAKKLEDSLAAQIASATGRAERAEAAASKVKQSGADAVGRLLDEQKATSDSLKASKALAGEKSKGAEADAEAEKRANALADAVGEANQAIIDGRLEAEARAIESAEREAEARLAVALEAAEVEGATEEDLLDIRRKAFAESRELALRRTGLIEAQAEAQVDAERSRLAQELELAAAGSEEEVALARAAELRILAIRQEAAEKTGAINRKRQEEDRKFTLAQLALIQAKGSEVFDEPEEPPQVRNLDVIIAGLKGVGAAVFGALDGVEATLGAFDGSLREIPGLFLDAGDAALGGLLALGDAAGDALSLTVDAFFGLLEEGFAAFAQQVVAPIAGALQAPLSAILGGLGGALGAITDPSKSKEEAAAEAGAAIKEGAAQALAISERLIELLPGVVEYFLQTLTASLPELLANLTTAVVSLIETIAPLLAPLAVTFITGILNALPRIISALVDAIPVLIQGIVQSVAPLLISLAQNAPKILTAVIESIPVIIQALISQLPILIAEIIKALPTIVTELVLSLGEGIRDLFASLLGGGESGIPIIGGLIDSIGSLFHSGGMVRGGHRNVSGALALAGAGAPRFALGGMVGEPGSLARTRLRQVLGSDDVPAVLQAGEAVLSRQGVRAAGGEVGVAALNRGGSTAPGGAQGPLVANVALIGRDVRPLLQQLISAVAVDLASPTGATHAAVRQTVTRAPLMARAVRGR